MEVLVPVVGLVVVDFVIMAYLFRKKKGSFKIRRDDPHAFVFVADFGRFSIDRRGQRFQFGSADETKVLDFSEIARRTLEKLK